MHILILGGTLFLGPHLVEQALHNGHTLTLLHRGTTTPEFSQPVEHLYADRNNPLKILEGRSFDAVIDTSARQPHMVAHALTALKATPPASYVFISSISVYRDFAQEATTETAATLDPADVTSPDPGIAYGAAKVQCEALVRQAFPDSALIVRPGLIVGPYDSTDRFTYWVRRLSEGGQVVLPGPPDRPMQYIDVRDLARWLILQLEHQQHGTFNLVGTPQSFAGLVEAVEATTGAQIEPIWVNDDFLLQQGVTPWSQLPLWLPSSDASKRYFHGVSHAQAAAHGLSLTPLQETVRDVFVWDYGRRRFHQLAAGLSSEQEQALLNAWEEHDPGEPPA